MKMRLKLLAPFLSPGFSLRSALVAHEPEKYETAWVKARNQYSPPPLRFEALDKQPVVRFEHTGNTEERKRSRYRTISSDSLARPLPVIELQVPATGDPIVRMLRESFPDRDPPIPHLKELIESIALTLRDGKRTALLRVYDYRVSIMQLDFKFELKPSAFEIEPSRVDEEALGNMLDGLQEGAILFAEKLVDLYHDEILVPLFTWIREETEVGNQFIDTEDSARVSESFLEGMARQRCRTLWVTRSLILEEKDGLTPDFRQALIRNWLKDVPDDGRALPRAGEKADSKTKKQAAGETKEQAGSNAEKQPDSETMESTRWLNYLFAEKSYPGEYPEQGWSRDKDGNAQSFSPTWDAMEVAQYYYSAFDLVQTSVSHILAVSLSRTGEHKVNEMQWLLDLAIREAQMLKVEYYENRKYYSREVEKKLGEILKYWGFENLLEKQTEQRVKACVERLTELNARAAERSAILTDLVLLAIGVTSVFGVGLALAQYGRAQTLDPALIPYEGVSFNVAQWIAARSTDGILLASLGMSLALIVIYAVFRMMKYKA